MDGSINNNDQEKGIVIPFDDSIFKGKQPPLTPQLIADHIGSLVDVDLKPLESAEDSISGVLTSRVENEILSKLLSNVTVVDFVEKSGVEAEKDLTLMHYLVTIIEQLHVLARNLNLGICKNQGQLHLYNGTYWEMLDKDEFVSFLGLIAEKMGLDKAHAKHYEFRDKLYKQFIAQSHLPSPRNNDGIIINLVNGTFEITPEGNKLREFERNDFLTYQLPFSYDPTADAPLFKEYLDKSLPDKESQKVLAEFLGYVFIPNTRLKLEKALLLYGEGANGKSVFFEIVNALLGNENFSAYSLQSLTNNSGYHRARLANKLVNYASEVSGNMETAIFKQLVSGEPVEARFPYEKPFQLMNYAKLIFNVNQLPKNTEHTHAFFRRFLIIPFTVTIPPEEQDKELSGKIIAKELPGVFNWMLDGLERVLKNKGFSKCKAAEEQINIYKRESDSVRLFIEDNNYQPHKTKYIKLKDFYSDYRTYCIDDGYKPVNKSNFKKRLNHLRIFVERKNEGNVVFVKSSKQTAIQKFPYNIH